MLCLFLAPLSSVIIVTGNGQYLENAAEITCRVCQLPHHRLHLASVADVWAPVLHLTSSHLTRVIFSPDIAWWPAAACSGLPGRLRSGRVQCNASIKLRLLSFDAQTNILQNQKKYSAHSANYPVLILSRERYKKRKFPFVIFPYLSLWYANKIYLIWIFFSNWLFPPRSILKWKQTLRINTPCQLAWSQFIERADNTAHDLDP